jgi:hypothetical protein
VPDVQRLAGGAVIAQLGTSSDEYLEELQQVSEKVDDLLDWYGASPQFGSALPVYPDITSLLQTADDLHMDRQTLAWAHLLPRELFAWVEHKLFCGVALNVYKDRNSPLYALLSQPHVAELGRGRIPDALW